MIADPSSLHWNGADLLRARHQKSAAGLLAIRAALSRHEALGEAHREIVTLIDGLREVDAAMFGAVWTDPTAYFWVRTTFDLLAHRLSGAPLSPLVEGYAADVAGGDAGAALDLALEDLKRFVIAIHHRAGGHVQLVRPLEVALPFAIPGSELVVSGEGRAQIYGLSAGSLAIHVAGNDHQLVLAPGAEAGPLSIHASPVARRGDVSLRLQPELFALPGLRFTRPVLAAGREYHARHHGLIERTLEAIEAYAPERFQQLGETMRAVGLKPRAVGEYTNISHSHLPGAFVAAVVESPLELGDTFIHELHHNRLFFLEEHAVLFADRGEGRSEDSAVYSPWRDEPRPVIGLFHAVYVHLPVVQFWLGALAGGRLTPEERSYAIDRVLRYNRQIELANQTLDASVELAELGQSLYARMKEVAAELRAARVAMGLPDDVTAMLMRDDGVVVEEKTKDGRSQTVRELVEAHRVEHEVVSRSPAP